mgnify:CR=1 FL=1
MFQANKNNIDFQDSFLKELGEYIELNYKYSDRNKRLNDVVEFIRIIDGDRLDECRPRVYGSSPISLRDLEKYREEQWKESLEEKTFSATLRRLIKEKNKTNTDVYKKALLDRKHFSKIMLNNNYCPSKNTAISLAIALELTYEETQELLSTAGFVLSESILTDIIVSFFIKKERYNMFELNEILVSFKLKPLQN